MGQGRFIILISHVNEQTCVRAYCMSVCSASECKQAYILEKEAVLGTKMFTPTTRNDVRSSPRLLIKDIK